MTMYGVVRRCRRIEVLYRRCSFNVSCENGAGSPSICCVFTWNTLCTEMAALSRKLKRLALQVLLEK